MRITRRTEIGFWLLVGVVGFCIYTLTYAKARPEASLYLEMDRNQALAKAGELVTQQGYDITKFRSAVVFVFDHDTKYYLEKNLGQTRANTLMAGEIATWYWDVRFYVPQQLEEFWVSLRPDGRLVEYFHKVNEMDPGRSLSVEAAEAKATQFLNERKHLDLTQYEIVERSQEKRPNCLDQTFTWKKKEFEINGAPYCLSVTVQGDRVGFYREWLKVPEQWRNEQVRLYSQRNALVLIAWAGMCLFCLYAFFVILRNMQDVSLRYSFGVLLTVAVLIVQVLVFLNELRASWLQYDTTQSPGVFIMGRLGAAFKNEYWKISIVFLMSYAANYMAGKVFPSHVPISHVFAIEFWRSKPVLRAIGVGLALAFFDSAFYNLFYIAGSAIGVWCPIAMPDINAVALPMPWLVPFEGGFVAALTEELLFRLFAISALFFLTKRKWLSILIPAVVWGFLHCNYPQEPIYIRGIELSLIGIVYGCVFVRYGIMATIISHFTYNALAGSDYLLRSGNVYLFLCGLCVLILPVLPLCLSGVLYLRGIMPVSLDAVKARPLREWKRKKNVDTDSTVTVDPLPIPHSNFVPLSKCLLAVCGMGAVIGIALSLMLKPPERLGDYIQLKINRQEAKQIADTYLRARGIEVDKGYRRLILFDAFDEKETDYCWQKVGTSRLNQFYQTHYWDRGTWGIKYFKEENPEYYWVTVSPDGIKVDVKHILPQAAPGARISEQKALELAINGLRERGLPVDQYHKVEAKNMDRPKRLDYDFTFEYSQNALGEAHLRKEVRISGDEFSGVWSYIKLPESWKREHAKHHWWEYVSVIVVILFWIGVAIWENLKHPVKIELKNISFRPYLPYGLMGALGVLLFAGNTPIFPWGFYHVAEASSAFWTKIIVLSLVVGVVIVVLVGVLFAIIGEGFKVAFPTCRPLHYWFKIKTEENYPYRLAWGEALVLACFFSLMVYGINAIAWHIIPQHPFPVTFMIYMVYLPTLFPISCAIMTGCFGIMTGMMFFMVFKMKGHRIIAPLILGMGILCASQVAQNMTQWVVLFLAGTALLYLFIGILWGIARYLYRDNLPAYLLSLMFPYLLFGGMKLYPTPDAFYRMNGILLLACFGACGLVGGGLYLSGMRQRNSGGNSAGEEEGDLPVVE